LFQVLEKIYDPKHLGELRAGYEKAIREADNAKGIELFKAVALNFARGAGRAAGASVFAIVKAHLGLP